MSSKSVKEDRDARRSRRAAEGAQAMSDYHGRRYRWGECFRYGPPRIGRPRLLTQTEASI